MYVSDLFKYVIGNSVFHRSHPATKIIWSFCLIAIAWVNTIATLISLIISMSSLIIAGVLREKISVIKSYILISGFFFILNWFLYSISYPSKQWIIENIFSFEGLSFAGLLTIRILIILLTLQVFFATTTPEEIEDFLLSLGFPAAITISFILTLIFIPIIMDEAKRIREAQLLRGLTKSRFSRKLRVYLSSLILPLIVSSLNRANRIAEVLEIYGVPPEKRTILSRLAFTNADLFIILILFIIIIPVLLL